MENATKALIMAAGVLMGIVILSLAVYEFTSFGISSKEIHKANEETRLNEFNSQFTKYEGKDDVTIYDVITVANLAKENNSYYEFSPRRLDQNTGKDLYISVILDDNSIENQDQSTYKLKIDSEYNSKYTCIAIISNDTGRVYKVKFSKQQ